MLNKDLISIPNKYILIGWFLYGVYIFYMEYISSLLTIVFNWPNATQSTSFQASHADHLNWAKLHIIPVLMNNRSYLLTLKRTSRSSGKEPALLHAGTGCLRNGLFPAWVFRATELPSHGSPIEGKEAETLGWLRRGSLKSDWIECQLYELGNNSAFPTGQLWEKVVKSSRRGQRPV